MIAFEINNNLEVSVKGVISAMFKKHSLHLTSKYSKDCDVVVTAENDFSELKGGRTVFFNVERTDGKNVQSNTFHISLDDTKEFAVLSFKFSGSVDYKKVQEIVNVKDTQYSHLVKQDSAKIDETIESLNELNATEKMEELIIDEISQQNAEKKEQMIADIQHLEDIHDIPYIQAREILINDLEVVESSSEIFIPKNISNKPINTKTDIGVLTEALAKVTIKERGN